MNSRKMDTPWSHVHGLTVLSQMGSYTAAAQRLGISKALMSQRVSELEQTAGVPLVRRTTRSVRLTEAGQQLVNATQGAFEDIERGLANVRDLAAAPSGLVRVTAPVALGRQHVAPRLPAFLHQHPAVRIELDLSDRLVSLAREGFDLAIRHAPSVPETHVAWTLCRTQSMLVASRAYLRRRGTPAAPQDLPAHDCLTYPRSGHATVWGFVPRRGGPRQSVAPRGSFAANNSEALREAALAGLGIALLPDFSAQHDLARGKLVPVLPEWQAVGTFADRLYALRPHTAHVPRAVQALVAFLRESLAGGFTAPSRGHEG